MNIFQKYAGVVVAIGLLVLIIAGVAINEFIMRALDEPQGTKKATVAEPSQAIVEPRPAKHTYSFETTQTDTGSVGIKKQVSPKKVENANKGRDVTAARPREKDNPFILVN